MTLFYSPHESTLVDEEGTPLLLDVEAADYKPAGRVAPGEPGRKSATPHVLKIQLGMQCNYSCSYCNQAAQSDASTVTRTADADDFIAGLDRWLHAPPRRIEFWGGEPLLYFAKLKRLVPALRARFPSAVLSMISNGSLIDGEVLDFIEEYDIFVAVSHDGPGQHLRGPDPFLDPVRAHWLREFWRRRGGAAARAAFHFVLTPRNADIGETRQWLADRIGDPSLNVDMEGVVTVYDQQTLGGPGSWSDADYERMRVGVRKAFADGDAPKVRDLAFRAQDFVESLRNLRPSSSLGQRCGMDDPDHLAVDLQGNVMTCQNTGARGKHRIGHAEAMHDVQLTTATHWSHRESCNHCPVLQLCKGSCMYLQDDLFAQSCENEYQFNLAVLGATLHQLTTLTLKSISGDIRRPQRRRVIPLVAA
ncbi:MAG: hypothetical protein JWP65_3744 [Ramlibacter sp.]|uniref:radical SAM/SPASM domain-containing protein n=1 Tax=Ramlibacter sp. TaxID=1917967 RepID=UPI002602C7A8|nr:radical SAM protein [Ramlibacter sp.]MDB5753323.1 hypothetical protein [Ramlibacter sp.]